jgi:hypothetical protein
MSTTSKTATISRSRFVQVPARFLELLVKNKEYAWVWMVLWDKAGASKEAWISVAGLIESCKMNIHTIKNALKWLVDNGYVKRISRPGQVTHYELSIEARWAKDEDNGVDRSIPGAPKSPRASADLGLPEAPPTWGSQEPHELQNPVTSEREESVPLAVSASACTASTPDRSPQRPPRGAVGRIQPLMLPSYAEPFREALETWLKQSRRRNRSKGPQLSSFDLRGLEAAKQMGVLAEFCELASNSSWQSLGFSGHTDCLQKLQRDAKFHSTGSKKEIKELTDEDFM